MNHVLSIDDPLGPEKILAGHLFAELCRRAAVAEYDGAKSVFLECVESNLRAELLPVDPVAVIYQEVVVDKLYTTSVIQSGDRIDVLEFLKGMLAGHA